MSLFKLEAYLKGSYLLSNLVYVQQVRSEYLSPTVAFSKQNNLISLSVATPVAMKEFVADCLSVNHY